jgi:hypothetical protein
MRTLAFLAATLAGTCALTGCSAPTSDAEEGESAAAATVRTDSANEQQWIGADPKPGGLRTLVLRVEQRRGDGASAGHYSARILCKNTPACRERVEEGTYAMGGGRIVFCSAGDCDPSMAKHYALRWIELGDGVSRMALSTVSVPGCGAPARLSNELACEEVQTLYATKR